MEAGLDVRSGRAHAARGSRRRTHVGALPRLADDDEHGADGRDLSFGHENPQNRPGVRRRDLDRRLVGLDLYERVVLGELLTLGDEPARDLTLGETLAEIRQLEGLRHVR